MRLVKPSTWGAWAANSPLGSVVRCNLADFYRAGDGNDESFTAQMIVSTDDIAPDIAGTRNAWIQGVGCASAIANFSS